MIANQSAVKSRLALISFCFILVLIVSFHAEGLAQSTTSITLTWTAPGDDGSSGTASQYDVRYSTSPINASNFASATQATGEPSPQVAGSEESFSVTGLLPNTLYYFALKTADESGNWSDISNVISVTTDDTVAPGAVSDLAVSGGE